MPGMHTFIYLKWLYCVDNAIFTQVQRDTPNEGGEKHDLVDQHDIIDRKKNSYKQVNGKSKLLQ